jgi:type III restriction enzyme
VDAYDLILKDKERLLSLRRAGALHLLALGPARRLGQPERVRDLRAQAQRQHDLRRQEVGRGLRLSVNQHGDRMDHPATVHDVNVLTVVASESYKDFVSALQKDISESLSARPKVREQGLLHRQGAEDGGGRCRGHDQATGHRDLPYLVKNDYVDKKRPHQKPPTTTPRKAEPWPTAAELASRSPSRCSS